jgi:serine/threonine protein kinase
MTECPPEGQLRALLAGQLAAEVAEPVSRHTDQCAQCQRRLELLSEDPTEGRWRQLLRPAVPGDEPTRVSDGDQLAATRVSPPGVGVLRRLQDRRPVPPPPVLPGYEILGELGRGGMGVVYKARQTALKRLVALKVIGSGALAAPSEISRFCAEAEAVARLQHPNIVQIYEIGEHEGRPFFSLEYVEGGTLAQRLDGTPLSPRAAAELVRTLALAIQAAHQRGIVHRDLKPANILLQKSEVRRQESEIGPPGRSPSDSCLLTSDFSPKVADFGLAKEIGGEPGLTQTGMIVGTPSYMAPEQAAGHVHDIGPACDVYALGAILYECLTGRPPFNAATQFLTLQQVQWLPPVAPSGFQPAVPRDVETVCLKCLEKEPHRRYASAQDLADDLDRFLTGRPIQARPAGWLEHAWKWARRRPAVAALLGTLAAAVLVVIGVLLWSVVRVSHEAQRAREQAEYAQNAVDDMYSDVAMDWLAEDPDKNFLQRKFLGRALGYYKRLAAEDAAEPAARRRTARAHFRMGELNRMLNEPAKALAEYQEAIDRQLRLRDEFPGDPDYREDLAESYNWRGEVLRETSKSLAEAERDFRAALELQDQLAREAPGEPRYRRALARSYSNLVTPTWRWWKWTPRGARRPRTTTTRPSACWTGWLRTTSRTRPSATNWLARSPTAACFTWRTTASHKPRRISPGRSTCWRNCGGPAPPGRPTPTTWPSSTRTWATSASSSSDTPTPWCRCAGRKRSSPG